MLVQALLAFALANSPPEAGSEGWVQDGEAAPGTVIAPAPSPMMQSPTAMPVAPPLDGQRISDLAAPMGPERLGWAKQRTFLSSAGLSQLVGGVGAMGSLNFGLQISPFEHVALRLPVHLVYAGNWGEMNAFGISPYVVYRFGDGGWRVHPYAGAGYDFGLTSIDPEGLRIATHASNAWGTGAHLNPPSNAAPGEGNKFNRNGNGLFGGGNAVFVASPQATAGLEIRMTQRVSLDVGMRYVMIPWGNETRHAFSEQVGVSVPF